MQVAIKVEKWVNFTENQKAIAQKGLWILETALAQESFHQKVIKAYFDPDDTEGLTNEQIWARLESGADDMDETVDHVINLNFRLYYSWWSRVVGYVYPGVRMIHVNKKYFGNPVRFASNAIHEYCHMMGFHHKSATDYDSVPYEFNALFEAWYEKNFDKNGVFVGQSAA